MVRTCWASCGFDIDCVDYALTAIVPTVLNISVLCNLISVRIQIGHIQLLGCSKSGSATSRATFEDT